jgi:hypothetical protein
MLDCASDAAARHLLQPTHQNATAGTGASSGSAIPGSPDSAMLAQTLASIQQLLAKLAPK